MVVSQNEKQELNNHYSYTDYDFLGRINEVGQVYKTTAMSTSIARDTSSSGVNSWIAAGTRTEITRTYYDVEEFTILYKTFAQNNLRSRVSSITYQDVEGSAYDYATHYSYDIHGNVNQLVQQNAALAFMGQNYKLLEYKYDLVSGNVNEVLYQDKEPDAFYHRYTYDADNRIIEAYTSADHAIWDKDAAYEYYLHGPLARTELGHLRVQGLDYAYTIHGWMKGINSNTLQPGRDIGRDGKRYSPNRYVAQDAYGFTLGYYSGDYTAAGGSQTFEATYSSSTFNTNSTNLYNGNIRHMVTAIGKLICLQQPQPGRLAIHA
jgi:hypothetical protein